jgi:Flp pilus assembly protein CpaB
MSQTLLQNVLVLDVAGRKEDGSRTGETPSITVAVSPEDAEVVALMAEGSEVVATLRPVQDDTTFDSVSRTVASIVGNEEPKAEEKPKPETGKKIKIFMPGGPQELSLPR